MWPLLFTAQPTWASTNQMSSVRELATGALVGRQTGGLEVEKRDMGLSTAVEIWTER
jgi:hypothetical protein